MSLLLSASLVLTTALVLSDLYRLSTWSARIVAFYVFCWAHIVVVAQTVGALNLLRPAPYFAMQIIICAVCIAVWYVVRRHELSTYPARWRAFLRSMNSVPLVLWRAAKRYPALVLLALLAVIAVILWAIQFIAVPSNSWDSLVYHLARVGYWLQHQSLLPYDALNERQISFPIVSSLAYTWIALFDGSDRLFGAAHWSSGLVIMPAVYGLARLIGASRPQASFAALFWLMLPPVALLSTSTLNDLTVAAFIVIAVYLLLYGMKKQSVGALMVSAFSVGLAFGTKSTAFFVVPGAALTVLLFLCSAPRRHFRLLLSWSAACLFGISALGSFVYITNTVKFGSPLGSQSMVELHIGDDVSRLTMLAHNSLRYAHAFIDPEGLPQVVIRLIHRFRTGFIGELARIANLDLNDDRTRHTWQDWEFGQEPAFSSSEMVTWYGIAAPLLLLPALIAGAFAALRQRDMLRAALVIIPVTFALSQFALEPFSVHVPRYFAPAVALTCALAAVLLPTPWLRGLRPAWIVVIISSLSFHATLNNGYRPYIGISPFWTRGPFDHQVWNSSYLKANQETIAACVPDDGQLGIVSYHADNFEYVYFGEGFTRALTPIQANRTTRTLTPPPESFAHIPFLFAHESIPYVIPEDFVLWRRGGDFDLFVRATMTDQALCARDAS